MFREITSELFFPPTFTALCKLGSAEDLLLIPHRRVDAHLQLDQDANLLQPPTYFFFKEAPLCFLPQAQEKCTVNIHIIVFKISLKLSFAMIAIKLFMTLGYYHHIVLCSVHRTMESIFPPVLFGNIRVKFRETVKKQVSKKIKNLL